MIRQVISIDEEKCDGCGVCVDACAEGALSIVDGKAKLVREDYCDGLGSCLCCPKDAISFETRDAKPFVENTVIHDKIPMCPGLGASPISGGVLEHWPIKIDLVPTKAQFFDGSELIIAADCTAFAYPDIHRMFGENAVVIGCPKLDRNDHTQKLTEIIKSNNIRGMVILRMEVPCCGALDRMARSALLASGKDMPIKTMIVSRSGSVQ